MYKQGFTMAEILLSLTIIGVVAAITLPSLTGNINERTWNTQRKALYARFSQAISLMPALNGYGILKEETDSAGSTSIEDTAAETFITSGLAKVMKINNICDDEHLEDCGITNKLSTLHGSTISIPQKMSELNPTMISYSGGAEGTLVTGLSHSQIDTKAAAFETGNGESLVVYYNPRCISDMDVKSSFDMVQPKICANFIFDLNGTKGPNTVGKDIGFMTVLYSNDPSVVMPMPHMNDAGNAEQYNASALCTQQDSEYRLPNRDEMASIFVNKRLVDMTTGRYWTSSVVSSQYAYIIGIASGDRNQLAERAQKDPIRCVKR